MNKENGALDICLIKNPLDKWNQEKGDRYSGMQITWDEWSDLFYNVLNVQKPDEYANVESYNEFNARQRHLFEEDLRCKGFPLLGRIADIYEDSCFLSDEVPDLLNECLSIAQKAEDILAKNALNKLITVCVEAKKGDFGIVLVSD
jgi:hypothetical protein